MAEFAIAPALIGGALIGLAAVLLMALNGRIAGISGIVDGVLAPLREGFAWKFAFAAGLVLAPLAWWAATGAPAQASYPHSAPLVVLGGLLVGFGTRLGSGCTSGHGVCGLARLSKRSLAATLVFMTAGALAVFLVRQIGG